MEIALKSSRRRQTIAGHPRDDDRTSKRFVAEDMIESSYKEREEKAVVKAEGLRRRLREAVLKNRALFDR